METSKLPSSFELLGELGHDVATQVEGYHAIPGSVKNTSSPNVWCLDIQKADGSGKKTVFAGRKTFDAGFLVKDEAGHIVIAKGFELASIEGKMTVVSKERQRGFATLKVIE